MAVTCIESPEHEHSKGRSSYSTTIIGFEGCIDVFREGVASASSRNSYCQRALTVSGDCMWQPRGYFRMSISRGRPAIRAATTFQFSQFSSYISLPPYQSLNVTVNFYLQFSTDFSKNRRWLSRCFHWHCHRLIHNRWTGQERVRTNDAA